jgi:leucyl/phenylalanyl-tRNA--protein transferase
MEASVGSVVTKRMITWLGSPDPSFPPLHAALAEPNGLLAAGGDLRPTTLISAYRRGIFPWYAEGQPILWWSPDPRMVLYVSEFRASRSLKRRLAQGTYEIGIDSNFEAVIRACATTPRLGQHGTWITTAIMDAYIELHALGYCHSLETYEDGVLVGGLYGLALGRVFFGESMFAHRTDASKVALATLVELMQQQGGALIDCQQETAHLASLGARAIPRRLFASELGRLIHCGAPSPFPRTLDGCREQTE